MPAPLHKAALCLFLLLSLAAATLRGQRARGELRIEVRDSQGASLPADAELLSEANQVHRTFQIALDGRYTAQDLPFGIYRLTIRAEGFASWTNLVELRSEVPLRVPVTLGVAPVATQIKVTDNATLVDPSRTGSIYSVGRQTIDQERAAQPGRNLSDLVNQQPGWLYEANGVLHPRGSEYDFASAASRRRHIAHRIPSRAGAAHRWLRKASRVVDLRGR